MLARERAHSAAAAAGCTPLSLAAALAALPSRPLEMVAKALVALAVDTAPRVSLATIREERARAASAFTLTVTLRDF